MTAAMDEANRAATTRARPLEVDVRHVTFIDSTGLAGAARLALGGTIRPQLHYPPPVVDFVLEATDMGRHFDLVHRPIGDIID